jgi:hypothetical protein
MADGWDQFAEAPKGWDSFAEAKASEPAKASPPKFTPGRAAGLTARNVVEGLAAIPGHADGHPASIYNAGADLVQCKNGKAWFLASPRDRISASTK